MVTIIILCHKLLVLCLIECLIFPLINSPVNWGRAPSFEDYYILRVIIHWSWLQKPVAEVAVLPEKISDRSESFWKNTRFWNKMVSIFEIFRLRRAHINCLNKGNAKFWNKMVLTLRNFSPAAAHNMCFNKGSVISWNKKVSTFKIFRLRQAHNISFDKGKHRFWNKKVSNTQKSFACGRLFILIGLSLKIRAHFKLPL